MKHLQYVITLVICFAAGVGIAKVLYKVFDKSHPASQSRTGVGDPPAMHGFSFPPNSPPNVLDALPALHTTAIALQYPFNPDTLKRAHEQGFRVVLLPPPNFSATSPYPVPLAQVAAEAQEANIDALCVSWLNTDPDPAYWKEQINGVRAVFKGQIILAAELRTLTAADILNEPDVLGVIGPIPIPTLLPHAPDNVTLDNVRIFWQARLDELESLANAHGKKLALLNMIVPVTTPAKLLDPTKPAGLPPLPNPEYQHMVYEALLLETKGRNSSTTMLFFTWAQVVQTPPDAIHQIPDLLSRLGALWQATPTSSAAPANTP